MTEIPYAKSKRTNYENFIAQCPWCEKDSIFNRATDFNVFAPIAFRTVTCLDTKCGKPFNINGDSVNSAHETLVLDCHELLQFKHYMSCILTLAQAYEVFFNLFLRVELLYKPFAADQDRNQIKLNKLSKSLSKKIAPYSFIKMRALFLKLLVSARHPKSITEAKEIVEALCPCEPTNFELNSLSDEHVLKLVRKMKSHGINTLRNKIAHKQAYRPTKKEAELALKETRSILFPLSRRLNLYDDVNWYLSNSEKG